jgi:hypothetical protein
MSESRTQFFPDQALPLGLTAVVFVVMALVLLGEIHVLNFFVIAREKIVPHLRWADVLVGVTIYLKTSIDFAIFIGRLMSKFPGWKNRVMIEIGTAMGNALGTMAILLLWDVFREIRFLMALMIVIAALVLFRLAEEGLDHVKDQEGKYKFSLFGFAETFEKYLSKFNRMIAPVLNKIVPRLSVNESGKKTLAGLFMLSFSIPFLLGLDDFAGYISLFNIVNIFGFGVGIFLGHMILNVFLFLSPHRTIQIVKNPVISFAGSIAFVGLGIWGLFEAVKIIGFGAH